MKEEATEDIQKLGGMEALDAPYLSISLHRMIRKRGGWLAALFFGEMLTATAMTYFQDEIARAVVLALFVPLIISSGGNSGSQATTLVIRAMALGEVRIRDWGRVVVRELASGRALGAILASIGLLRILLWQAAFNLYGEHYVLIALTVAGSLVGCGDLRHTRRLDCCRLCCAGSASIPPARPRHSWRRWLMSPGWSSISVSLACYSAARCCEVAYLDRRGAAVLCDRLSCGALNHVPSHH